MPLDPEIEPVTDLDPPAVGDPEFHAKVWHREDGDWGVSIRTDNHRHVWGNDEGWTDLAYTLEMVRRSFPGIRIEVFTTEEAAVTVVEKGADLPLL